MKDAHAGLKISEKEFYTMVEALRIALDGNGVPKASPPTSMSSRTARLIIAPDCLIL